MQTNPSEVEKAVLAIEGAEGADILLFNGPTNRTCVHSFISTVSRRKRRSRVVLVLITSGGDADAAYRMARCLQGCYEHVTVFVPGWCKSAGTLLAIGAHRLVMSPFAELGPLDVQVGKRDDLFEYGSGLEIDAAMSQLETMSFSMFSHFLMSIEHASGNRVTFKTASQLAADVVTKLFGNIYAQIDPMKIGETTRLMMIAKDYGERLAAKGQNFARTDGIDLLVSAYSSHGFVIDFEEAATIFKIVEQAPPAYVQLMTGLGDAAFYPIESTTEREYISGYLSKELPNETEPSRSEAAADDTSASNRTGRTEANSSPDNLGNPGSPDGTSIDPANGAHPDISAGATDG